MSFTYPTVGEKYDSLSKTPLGNVTIRGKEQNSPVAPLRRDPAHPCLSLAGTSQDPRWEFGSKSEGKKPKTNPSQIVWEALSEWDVSRRASFSPLTCLLAPDSRRCRARYQSTLFWLRFGKCGFWTPTAPHRGCVTDALYMVSWYWSMVLPCWGATTTPQLALAFLLLLHTIRNQIRLFSLLQIRNTWENRLGNGQSLMIATNEEGR